jgi:hypothetical protein
MKYLLFLLFPVLMNAQSFPDTLFTLNNKVFPCYITNISESRVMLAYAGSGESMLVMEAIDKIILSEMGTVYKIGNGFNPNFDEIELYVNEREELNRKLKEKKKSEMEILSTPVPVNNGSISQDYYPSIPSASASVYEDDNRWSFGFLFIPYYSGKIYGYTYNSNYEQNNYVTATINNEVNMEGQFAFRANKNLSLTFDVGYTSAYTDSKQESHTSQENYSYNSGTSKAKDLKLLALNLGVKYYFTRYPEKQVNVYALAGFGKQFAFSSTKYEDLFAQPTTEIYENNEDEFVENMNSPWNLNIGFGAEYMFNNSLSVYSVIRFYYSKIDAVYESRTISTNQLYTYKSEYTKSDFITRIGIGLNFYF